MTCPKLREAASQALMTCDGIADCNPRDRESFEETDDWIAWAKSRARWQADMLRTALAAQPADNKQCATCGFVGQEDPVKGCPKCGFDDMQTKAAEHRDGRLAALEEVAALKLALTAMLNDPAVIEAAQPGDIGRALCAVRGI